MRLLRGSLPICFAILSSQAFAQLFYDECSESKCDKGYIEKKEKIGDEQYSVKTMFLTYHDRGTTNADETHRGAKVYCNKNKPSVNWDKGKPLMIDKKVFSKPLLKKGKTTEMEKPAKDDETTSLWKRICPIR
jgi:hypothetical protein